MSIPHIRGLFLSLVWVQYVLMSGSFGSNMWSWVDSEGTWQNSISIREIKGLWKFYNSNILILLLRNLHTVKSTLVCQSVLWQMLTIILAPSQWKHFGIQHPLPWISLVLCSQPFSLSPLTSDNHWPVFCLYSLPFSECPINGIIQ